MKPDVLQAEREVNPRADLNTLTVDPAVTGI